MLQKFDEISPKGTDRLSQGALNDRASIEAVLRQVLARDVKLAGGVNRNHEIRRASIVNVSPNRVRLSLE